MKVYVKTPARLHLGLIDMNGDLGRMFGGLGVGINCPNVILEAEPAAEFFVSGQDSELTAAMAKRFFDAYQTRTNVHLHVKQAIPSHIGLGSGTQLSLAVAIALAKVLGLKKSTQELALAMGRCRRTGVGTAIFDQGGLVVDSGKRTQNGACIAENFPPLLFRQPFPFEWRFVVAIPEVKKGLASEKETAAFSKVPPMPTAEVGRMCRLIMLRLLPALAEKDIENFGDALTQIQVISGNAFAEAQGGTYGSDASARCIRFMQELGVYGVGQSSWGPTLYGVVKAQEAKPICSKVHAYLKRTVGGQVFTAKANNRGATIKVTK
ncbi:MAG: beta-ribofuranosylaminobenzene 5'-phosphate synthase family protein [Candidatus Bathyarchaeia archaeon]